MTAEQERSIKWKNNVNNPKINPNISVHRKGQSFQQLVQGKLHIPTQNRFDV